MPKSKSPGSKKTKPCSGSNFKQGRGNLPPNSSMAFMSFHRMRQLRKRKRANKGNEKRLRSSQTKDEKVINVKICNVNLQLIFISTKFFLHKKLI